jgi:anti-anti-sigma factor
VFLNSMCLLTCEHRADPPDHHRVAAIGEIDLASGPHLIDALRAAQADAHHVVLDLDGTTFIDMAGARILIAAAAHARATAGTFAIVHPTAPVTRLLVLIGADRALLDGVRLNFPQPKGAGDGAQAASPLPAGTWPSPLPSPSASARSN